MKLLPPTLVGGQLRGERVRSIAAAELHNLAVTEDGAVFSWGDATFGKLGHGNLVDWPAPRRVEAPHLPASPITSTHLPTPPHTSTHLHTPPTHLHTPPHTSTHLPTR